MSSRPGSYADRLRAARVYLVLEADADGVDLVLLDSGGEPDADPGDMVELAWEDVRSYLHWELVA